MLLYLHEKAKIMAYDSHCDFCAGKLEERRFTFLLNKWIQILCEECYTELSRLMEKHKSKRRKKL